MREKEGGRRKMERGLGRREDKDERERRRKEKDGGG
jgi:hypothetical protein